MEQVLPLLLMAYLLPIGFGLIVNGPRGAWFVHRLWVRAISGILGWVLEQIGDGLKALSRKIRR